MELVALRDIESGEELFLDYGDDWERSWQHHLETWQPAVTIDEEDPMSLDDRFLKKEFRHDIRLADDLFPEAWKNKKAIS
jgi:hypothetical protein